MLIRMRRLVLTAAAFCADRSDRVDPELLGIGLDEDTAIIVHGDRFQVLGASYAVIYDSESTTGDDGRFYFLAPSQASDMGERRVIGPEPIENGRPRPWGGN